MHRTLGTLLAATLLLVQPACKVERTPRQYYAQRDPAAAERELFAGEISDRVAAMGAALGRRDPGGAVFALAPAPEAYVIGPDSGSPAVGPDGVEAMLRALADTVPAEVRVEDVRVTFGPRAQTAWFATEMEVRRPERADTLRFSGVYQRERGEWLLMQGHLSRALTPPAAPPPSPADSAPPEAASEPEALPT